MRLNPAKPVPDKLSLATCHIEIQQSQACLLFSNGKENFCEQLLPKPTLRGAGLTLRLRRSHNLRCALGGDICPNPPRTFSFFHPDN